MLSAIWWCWLAGFLLEIVLLVRLAYLGLPRVFPFLCGWLFLDALNVAIRLPLARSTYWKVWAATEPVLALATLLAALEAFRAVIGMRDRHRLWLWVGIAALVTAAAAGGVIEPAQWSGSARNQGQFVTAKRYGCTVLFFALGFALAFIRVTVPGRNLNVHARILLAYFGSWSAGVWAIEWLGPAWLRPMNLALMIAWCGCLVAWLVYLKPEPPPLQRTPGGSTEELAEVTEALRSIRP